MKQVKIKTWQPGGMTSFIIDNDAFEVFKYSQDKDELQAALSWVDKALSMGNSPDANALDTKANI